MSISKSSKAVTIKDPYTGIDALLLFSFNQIQSKFSALSSKLSFLKTSSKNTFAPKKRDIKKFLPLFLLILLVATTTVFVVFRLGSATGSVKKSSDGRIVVSDPKASIQLNKEFTFPLKDSKDKKITDLKFVVESAELRNEIIVQGKLATAVQGRTFLIINLKLVSNYTKGLEINSKDYFRLTLNGNEADLIAPDIHNDPVLVQPTSTKFSRLGWPVNDTDKKLVLQVGEIGGPKTKVELNLN